MNPLVPARKPPEWFTKYLERGFKLIKYPQKSKHPSGPNAKDWPRKYINSADGYVEDSNWGVLLGVETEPGKYLADIDFDWQDGLTLAHRFYFKPPTQFVFGRGERKVTHAFFTTSQPVVSKRFEDIDGTVLVEIRGAAKEGEPGLQTMVPPSIHPGGDVITFRSDGDIGHDDALAPNTVLYAIACLLVRHLGHRNLKHWPRLALAGFLLRLGLSEDDVVKISLTVAEATDNNMADVASAVYTTVAKLKAGDQQVTGRRTLVKSLGENGGQVVARIEQWLGKSSALLEAIDKLNGCYAIVSVENKVVVMETDDDGGIRQLWPFEEFKRRHCKNRIPVGNKYINVADVWLTHEDGRQYDRLVYAMPGSVEQCGHNDYNGYLGFTVKPQPGDWSKNREHIRCIICGGNEQAFEWVLNWMAALVQYPGRHAFAAIVLRGEQGVGKGHFANQMLGDLFHKQQYLQLLSAGMLTGQFNEHLSGKALIFADESTWGGDPKAANKLQGLITESFVPIERKFLPLVTEPSALHIVIASNNEWPVLIPMSDRRFIVLDVSDAERQNDAYFGPLRAELANGGLAAMLFDLLGMTINDRALRHPPNTKAKRQVMLESLKGLPRWWFEKLRSGELEVVVPDEKGKPVTIGGWDLCLPKNVVHEDAFQFLQKHGDRRERHATETEVGMFLGNYTPLSQGRLYDPRAPEDRKRVWYIPSLEECRKFWVQKCNWPVDFDWDEES